MLSSRSSGILLHITSLPSRFGIGDLGPTAYRFADFLAEAGQSFWQVLPLVPVGYGYSPYASPSTFGGNPLFLSPEGLHAGGLLTEDDLANSPEFPRDHVDYNRVIPHKKALLRKAYERFVSGESAVSVDAFEAFCEEESEWLHDYALYQTLKALHDERSWVEWDPVYVSREPEAIASAEAQYASEIRMHKFWQFLFVQQWDALRAYCHEKGIRIIGDLPIYVAHDSADVWSKPHLFHLDEQGYPLVVAGVPPDYFSATGQLWGNPIYRWQDMEANGYAWWTRRFASIFKQVDVVRLDHFRGFEAFWQVPAGEKTAINGTWETGPGASLFQKIHENLGELPIIAEDLGVITDGVRDLMRQFNFPGMAVLQFAFDGDASSNFLPHNYQPNLVAYSGTHDNDTVLGWWSNANSTLDAESVARSHDFAQLYLDLSEERERKISWVFIQTLLASVANTVVIPLQDILGLGSEGRMNTPGTSSGNWDWRYAGGSLDDTLAERLRDLCEVYSRA